MTKSKKTQSPVKPHLKKPSAKKPAAKKATAKKPAGKPTSKKAPEQSAAFNAEELAALWQEKWQQMLQEKGWPDHLAAPAMGQMPFMMPFMMPGMGFNMAPNTTDTATIQTLLQRIEKLEARIMELEHALMQRTTDKAPKSRR